MNQPIKILVLEDKLTDVAIIQNELQKAGMKFEINVINNKPDFIIALDNYKADVILSNHACKQFNSEEALEIIKTKKLAIPFILVTESVNEEFAVKIIKLGADDYLIKNNLSRLSSAIEAILKHKKHNSTKQKLTKEKLQHNEALARGIFKSNMIGFIYWDENGEIIDSNDLFLETFGYTRQDILDGNLHWDKMTPPEYADRDQLALKEVAETGICLPYEKEYISKDGRRIPILIGAALVDEGIAEKGVAYVMDISERKKAEEKLQQSENLTKAIFNSKVIGFFYFDSNGEIIDANEFFLETLGFTRQDLLDGKLHWAKMTPPEYADRDQLALKELAETGICLPFEKVFICKDGTQLQILIGGGMVQENSTTKGYAYVMDITDRKKAEVELHNTLHKLEEAQEISGIGHWEFDLVTFERTWSKQVFKNYNFPISIELPLTEEILEHTHPDDRYIVNSAVEKAWKGIQTENFIIRTNPEFGPLKYLLNIWQLIYDEAGETKKILGTVQDITESKKADEALEDTLHKLEDAQQISGLGHWEMDLATSKRNWSKQVFKNFNFPVSSEVPDIAVVSQHIHPEDRDLMMANFEKITKGDRPENFIMKTNPEFGPLKYLLSSWHLMHDEDNGEVKKMIGTSQDITDVKEIELKLIAQNEALKKANTELDRFVYSASHDLRAPLKSMLGLTDLLQLELNSDNSDQSMLIDMIKKSVLKLDSFIEDILDYSRNARVDLHLTELNFNEIIEEIRGNHKFMEGAKEVVLKLDIQLESVFISDLSRVKIILNNLISNAVKYHDDKNNNSFVLIKIRCDQNKTMIDVTDNGIGIAKKDHEEIFKMFHRATNLSTGSGLGLYIVSEALVKLGGTINLESEIGKGSTFSLNIPNYI